MRFERLPRHRDRRWRTEFRQRFGQLACRDARNPARQTRTRALHLGCDLEPAIRRLAQQLARGKHIRQRTLPGGERDTRELDGVLTFLRDLSDQARIGNRQPRVDPRNPHLAQNRLACRKRFGARLPGLGLAALAAQPALVAAGNHLLPADADLRHVVACAGKTARRKVECAELQARIRQRPVRHRRLVRRAGIELQCTQGGLSIERAAARLVESENLPEGGGSGRESGQQQQ